MSLLEIIALVAGGIACILAGAACGNAVANILWSKRR